MKKRLSEVGLQLNNKECEYLRSVINFLGYIISEKGVGPDSSKVEAKAKMAQPADVTELRRYLDMVNYLGRYLPHLSMALTPLNQLLKKETALTWGPEQVEAFSKTRHAYQSINLGVFDPADM